MSAPLAQPLKRLESIIGKRLNNISEKMSVEELSKINTFMDEARKLHKSMYEISYPTQEEGGDIQVDDGEYTNFLFNGLVEACNLIVGLYQLMDDEKIKTLDSEWILDDTQAFMDHVREGIGYRIPELPPYRLVSKKKKK
jgi:hypothetical protein